MVNSTYYADIYYRDILGFYSNDKHYNITKSVFEYLIDAEISKKTIIKSIYKLPMKEYIYFNDLPESLWKNSLIKPNTFYYHNIIHLAKNMPVWNPVNNTVKAEKFFIEMKIKFSMQDLLDYYYKNFNISNDFKDSNKDYGAFKYLLDKYNKFIFIEPLDFTLSLVDYVKSLNKLCFTDILKLQDYEKEVYNILKPMCEEAKMNGRNVILWRTNGL